MDKTLIFGHRNPDTDTVCSAISLAYLENKRGVHAEARVLGHINRETAFALQHFGVKEPEYLNNVKVQLRNVHYNKGVMLEENASLIEVVDYMHEKNCTAVPIVDNEKHITGLITLKEIANIFVENSKDHLYTSYQHIVAALKGKEILHFHDEFNGKLYAGSYQSQTFIEKVEFTPSDILIVGDRYKVVEHAIKSGISLIVLTGNLELDETLLNEAREKRVSIISSSYDTYNTCNKIALSNYVKSLDLNKTPAVVYDQDYLTDFTTMAQKLGHTNYPILNKKEEVLGLIRVTDTGKYDKKNVILVDHNSLEQSVSGIDEASIVEIIDHHNLGAIGTSIPINVRCMPVGCTCTILYQLYQEYNVNIPKEMAGLMLSAILSDTLILKSPTTTDMDRKAVLELSKICDENYEEYGYQMLKAGSSIAGMSVDDVIYQDFKSYKIGNDTLGISQIITMDFDNIKENINDYVNKLDELSKNDYAAVTVFITDIIKNGSYVLYNTNAKNIVEDSFDLEEVTEGTFIKDLVSRKKQMLPKLMESFERNN